jgi:glutathione S-transferase
MAVALWLTRGRAKTFPLLVLEGQAIADSTTIIAELERRHPDPPLYPEDPAELQRALALEEFFDEELGPYSRLLAFHELRHDPDAVTAFAASLLPAPLARSATIRRLGGSGASAFAKVRYRVSAPEAAAHARSKIVAAFDRLEAELERGEGEYLAGDAFSVADLTAASLLGPIVIPPEGPHLPDLPGPYQAFRESLGDRPGYRWVAGVFTRHRGNPRRP